MPILKIPIPKGRLGIKLADGPESGNVVTIDYVLEDSAMKGKLFENDVIIGIGGTKVSSIEELIPLHNSLEGDSRYLTVKRDGEDVEESEEQTTEPDVDPHSIMLDEEKGIEKVKLPKGSTIGIRLDREHKVLEVVPTSIVLDKVFVGDHVVSVNETDVTGMPTKQLVKFLSEQDQANRVLGVKRAPNSPRQVRLPAVDRIGLVLRDDPSGWIKCLELLDKSPLKGIVLPGDRIIGANCRKVQAISELMPLMKDKEHRVLTVVTPKDSSMPENSGSKRKRSPQKTIGPRRNKSSLKAKSVSEEAATITLYKTVGQEVFINVIAPKGKLGMKLGKNHEVKDLLSTSPLAGKLFKDDRIVSIDEVDIRGRDASSLAVLLMASQHRARALGIRRKTGKKIRIVQEEKKTSVNGTCLEELEERFPNLYQFDLPLGDGATDTSTRCKILSELLALHETLGLANDVETENGSFCHVIKIPKKGLNRRGELMSTLDDVMASLDSICGAETDASDLLLEFLANRSPSSFLKHRKIAESRPKKRRKIEESKIDPNLDLNSPKRGNSDYTTDSQARIKNGNESGAKTSEDVPAQNLNESQTAGGIEARAPKKAKIRHSETDSLAREENDKPSEAARAIGVPNPLVEARTKNGAETGVPTAGVVAGPVAAANGGTTESDETDPLPKTANDSVSAETLGVANPLATIQVSAASGAPAGDGVNGLR